MAKQAGGAWILQFQSSRHSEAPLYLALYRHLREAILGGGLKPGQRMPSSRTLAQDLGLSRTTAEEALAKLEGEGFIRRRSGSGSFVAEGLPATYAAPREGRDRAPPCRSASPPLSARSRAVDGFRAFTQASALRPFVGGQPAPDAFPYEQWHRLLARRSRRSGRELLAAGDPLGHPRLREAIAEYLVSSRGVVCRPEQVLVTTSTQHALDLACRCLADRGDRAWIEDPGYLGARAALLANGIAPVPVRVDAQGMDVEWALQQAPDARLAYLTPSHQYPTGAALSPARRLALLDWARRGGRWIIEDDYDSEFRYTGRPLAALQGLDPQAPVVYLGTFSKSMFPALRLAYAVAPPAAIEAMATLRGLQDGHAPLLNQATLADFIGEGHFHSHLRRMKALYRGRRDLLLELLSRHCGHALQLGEGGGLHLCVDLIDGRKDHRLAQQAAGLGLALPCLSALQLAQPARQGFVLGFAALGPTPLREGVAALARLL